MWHVFGGEPFILKPKHADVFRMAVDCLSDTVGFDSDDDSWIGGEHAFDKLTQAQKQAAILMVCKGLLDPTYHFDKLTAATAGTVDAIYHILQSMIETEIEFDETLEVRRSVLAASE